MNNLESNRFSEKTFTTQPELRQILVDMVLKAQEDVMKIHNNFKQLLKEINLQEKVNLDDMYDIDDLRLVSAMKLLTYNQLRSEEFGSGVEKYIRDNFRNPKKSH